MRIFATTLVKRLANSKVFFSPNVNPSLRQHLCGILGVSSTPSIGKYMGFPLRPNGRITRDFDFIVEKVPAGKLSSSLLHVEWFLSNLLPPLFLLIICRMLLAL